tara:strand:+ start:4458 stop:4784 length:327 start_codon:yes stop_codon:yes gene_type:complete
MNDVKEWAQEAVQDIRNVKPKDVKKETNRILKETVSNSATMMNLGFTIATALAWNEAGKRIVGNLVRQGSNKNGTNTFLIYALAMTFASTLLFSFSKKYIKKDLEKLI